MELTFKQRVASFWNWFQETSPRFFDTIESGQCADLAEEVSEFMSETLPGLAWVFGPGREGGHSFTVSGEGIVAKQLLAEYWLSQSFELPGWTFFESRQPNRQLNDIEIEIGGLGSVDAESMLIKTVVDTELEAIDITAWHPLFKHLPENHHAQLLFLLLDETLGEFGTQTWLGTIDIDSVEGEVVDGRTVLRLRDLPKFINDVQRYHGWEKLSPLRSYTSYSIRKQNDFPRGDTIAGVTCIPRLIFDLLENNGTLDEDPLEGTGASIRYLALDGAVFPENDEASVRHNIEEALQESLEKQALGRELGGATGVDHSYIDVLLIDGEQSQTAVEQTLDGLNLQGRYRWHDFAS